MRNDSHAVWRWGLLLALACLFGGGQGVSGDPVKPEKERTLKEWLSSEYELKPKYVKGRKRYYRLWQTVEFLDPGGNLMGRTQWRGDLERVVESVDASGRAVERITWKNLGSRNWLMGEQKYGAHKPLAWANGFSYRFSAEEGYEDLNARTDYESVPKNAEGMLFRMAFQVSAHLEFDFLRSSSHGNIERLREVGSILLHPPEDGQKFSLDFPPLIVDSDLEKKHVAIGFLGLTQVNGEPCAIIDYQQGPQDFLWEIPGSQGSAFGLKGSAARWRTAVKSWHYGVFFVRLRDGSLVSGWLVEPTMGKTVPEGEGEPVQRFGRGTWSIQEITAEDYAKGLADWNQEQSQVPLFRPVVGGRAE